MMATMVKTYSELIKLKTWEDRYNYLKLDKRNEWERRWINQVLYQRNPEWKSTRRLVIIRDNGLDLGIIPISGKTIIHHINPITEEDILNKNPIVFDLENLICCSINTHNLIHYSADVTIKEFTERKPNDTIPWR